MNGLPQTDTSTGQSPAPSIEREQLGSLIRNSSQDSKVTFGAYRGTFDLSRNDIENFFHLVDQRVEEQNGCKAHFCEFAVYYNNGTSRKFPSAQEFNNYTETKNRFPTLVTLHLVYFIAFPDSDTPERQEVDIVIRASESVKDTINMQMSDSQARGSGDKVQLAVRDDNQSFGIINYTINHSKTSWGLDLEGHIRGHIESLLDEPSKSDWFILKTAGPLNLITTVFCGLYFVNLIIDFFFNFLYATDGATNRQDVLSLAAEYLVNGQIAKYIVASLIMSVTFFVLFSGVISNITNAIKKPKPSFISLCEADTRRKAKRYEKYKKRWHKYLSMVLLNVVVALFVTFIEDRINFIWKNWSDDSEETTALTPQKQ